MGPLPIFPAPHGEEEEQLANAQLHTEMLLFEDHHEGEAGVAKVTQAFQVSPFSGMRRESTCVNIHMKATTATCDEGMQTIDGFCELCRQLEVGERLRERHISN